MKLWRDWLDLNSELNNNMGQDKSIILSPRLSRKPTNFIKNNEFVLDGPLA